MITSAIIDALCAFKRTTGLPAKAIYMGRATLSDMRQDTEIMIYVEWRTGDRMKFDGVPIYTVDEDNYFAIG